jgi:hypothetical protein
MLAELPGPRRIPWRPVAAAGLLAGAFDLTFAFVFYYLRYGVGPGRILRSIASGVLGHAAFAQGEWVLPLGAALHFLIAVCAAFVFYVASRSLGVLTRHPVPCGAVFGVAMYVAMHYVVLPLSRVNHRVLPPADVIGELCSHVFLFGVVIALGVAHAGRAALRR